MSTGGEGHRHDFDAVSGWCSRCNLRQDGRLLGKGGDIFHTGHDHTPDELATIRRRIQGVSA